MTRKEKEFLLKRAREVFRIEADAVQSLVERFNDEFVEAIDILYGCKGRVIVSGIGKSGIVAKKIASTFASTGTPALFLHPTEGIHGDLGMVVRGDVEPFQEARGEDHRHHCFNQFHPGRQQRYHSRYEREGGGMPVWACTYGKHNGRTGDRRRSRDHPSHEARIQAGGFRADSPRWFDRQETSLPGKGSDVVEGG
jgi:hypothetical protein